MIYIQMPPEDADDEALDAEFPLGDGTADTAALVQCPYCGEEMEMALDPGSGPRQEYVEDCSVCCRPWQVTLTYDAKGIADVQLEPADDGGWDD